MSIETLEKNNGIKEEAFGSEQQDEIRLESELEDALLKYNQNKEIAKERNDENKLIAEKIEMLYKKLDVSLFFTQNADGKYISVKDSISQKDVLDKDALAHELQIDKKEFKTPWDISMLTKQGKLTPKMIANYTSTETEIKTKIATTKRKPKEKK